MFTQSQVIPFTFQQKEQFSPKMGSPGTNIVDFVLSDKYINLGFRLSNIFFSALSSTQSNVKQLLKLFQRELSEKCQEISVSPESILLKKDVFPIPHPKNTR